jgi:Nuclease-related domain
MPSSTIESEIALATERRGLDRRGAVNNGDLDEFWGSGRVGRIARAFFDNPHADSDVSGGFDGSGATSVETLERRTDRNRDERAVVLHNRRIPGTRDVIDHVVVAPSGVWVIDAIGLPGKVTQRNIGGWRKQEPRLYLGHVEQSSLLAGIDQKSSAVEHMLERVDVPGMSVDRAACFTAAEWPRMFAKPLRMSDVWITWPSNLAEMIVADGSLDTDAIHVISCHLDESLKSA